MAWPAGYTLLPGLSGGLGTYAYGVSADGAVIVGEADDSSGNAHAVYWTAPGVLTDLGVLPAGGQQYAWASAANLDGSVIVGVADDAGFNDLPFRWTAAGGMVSLGLPAGAHYGRANGVSADGAVVAGITNPAPNTNDHAFSWTAGGGFVDLPTRTPANATVTAAAFGLSGNGAVPVGHGDSPGANPLAVRWPNATTIELLDPGGTLSTAWAASSDGSVVVGDHATGGGTHAFRWTSGGLVDLGVLAGGTRSVAYGVTDDGATVAGLATTADTVQHVFTWTAGGGMVTLPDIPGADATSLGSMYATISRNGSVVAGYVPIVTVPSPISTAFVYAMGAGPAPPDFPLTGVVKVLLPPAELQFCDANGVPFAGGTLEFYQQDSTTPKATWNSPLGGDDHLNDNPLTLDAAGRAIIYGDGGYRTVLRDADGNLIWDQPSFTYISACMVPVVGAATLADARHAMGIDDAIEAEALARAAADSAEQSARIAADVALGARIDAEIARAEAAEAALGARIDGLPAPAPAGNTIGGEAVLDASGHCRVTFGTPFATTCTSFVVTGAAVGVWSGAFNIANQDRFGCDVWGSIYGSRAPASGVAFFWLGIGS